MTEHECFSADSDSEALLRVRALLDRQIPITALSRLRIALQQSQNHSSASNAPNRVLDNFDENTKFAIGFDTNALFHLASARSANDNALDYLTGVHDGPLIIPGQVVQEAWKNVITASNPYAKQLDNSIEQLRKTAGKIRQFESTASEEAVQAAENFANYHGDLIDQSTEKRFIQTIVGFEHRDAVCRFVPRAQFYDLAQVRNDTKTPPGFDDKRDNHGDFFVWADFLYGLAVSDLTAVDRIVFVTNDKKSDWSRNSVPHPILVAEVEALVELPFHLLSLEDFLKLVKVLT